MAEGSPTSGSKSCHPALRCTEQDSPSGICSSFCEVRAGQATMRWACRSRHIHHILPEVLRSLRALSR